MHISRIKCKHVQMSPNISAAGRWASNLRHRNGSVTCLLCCADSSQH